MVACLSPAENHLEETVNTLRYAERTRSITNVIKRNMSAKALTPAEAAALRRENKFLKKQLAHLTRLIMKVHGEKKENISPEQQQSVNTNILIQNRDDGVPTSGFPLREASIDELLKGRDTVLPSSDDNIWQLKYERLARQCENAGIHIDQEVDTDSLEMDQKIGQVQTIKRQIENALITFQSYPHEDDTVSTCSRTSISTGTSSHLRPYVYNDETSTDCDDTITTLQTEWTDEENSSRLSMDSYLGRQQLLKENLEDEVFVLEEKVKSLQSNEESLNIKIEETKQNHGAMVIENELIQSTMKENEIRLQKIMDEISLHENILSDKKVSNKADIEDLDRQLADKKNELYKLQNEKGDVQSKLVALTHERNEVITDLEDFQNVKDLTTRLCTEEELRTTCERKIESLSKELEKSRSECAAFKNELSRQRQQTEEEKRKRSQEEESTRKLRQKMNLMEEKQLTTASESRNKSEIESEVKNLRYLLERYVSKDKDAKSVQESERKTSEFMTPTMKTFLVKKIENERQSTCHGQYSLNEHDDLNVDKSIYMTPPSTIRKINAHGSRDDISVMTPISITKALNENYFDNDDTKSVLFPENDENDALPNSSESVASDCDSLSSEQRAIRLHAHKMLFWANKAIERKHSQSSNYSSCGSSVASFSTSRGNIVPKSHLPPRDKKSKSKLSKHVDDDRIDKPTLCSDASNDGKNDLISETKEKTMEYQTQQKKCTCSKSLFSGNAEHMDFFLPKLGLACHCGAADSDKNRITGNNDPLSLQNILRPWQVEFLKSQRITTGDKFLRYYKRNSKVLGMALKRWRSGKNMKPVRTKSCFIALYIWARTVKSASKSHQQKLEGGKAPKMNLMEISFDNDDQSCTESVSPIGSDTVIHFIEEHEPDEGEI